MVAIFYQAEEKQSGYPPTSFCYIVCSSGRFLSISPIPLVALRPSLRPSHSLLTSALHYYHHQLSWLAWKYINQPAQLEGKQSPEDKKNAREEETPVQYSPGRARLPEDPTSICCYGPGFGRFPSISFTDCRRIPCARLTSPFSSFSAPAQSLTARRSTAPGF